MKHFDNDGYHLYCLDAGCGERRKAALAAEAERRAAKARRDAIVPRNWKPGAEAAELCGDDAAIALWRGLAWSVEVSSRTDTAGTIDEGSMRVVGDDLYYYHGGHYDDYRPTCARYPGAAAAYLAALTAEVPEARWGAEAIREHGHFLRVSRAGSEVRS
jgi:hypothetical protein